MASKKILIQVDVTTKAAEVQIKNVAKSMNDLEGATAKFTETTKKSRAQSGLNNAILIESGRFASDLRFGFTAVANNLGRIIELGQEFSRTEGGGLVPALRRIISVQGLFLIGFQLLVAYGDKVFAFLRGLVTEVDITKDVFSDLSKQVGDTSTNFELYISKLQDSNTSQKEQEVVIKKLNDEFPDFVQNLKDSGISMEDIKNKTEDANIAIENQRKQIIALAKSRAAMNKIQEIQSEIIDEQIKGEKIAEELGYENFQAAVDRLKELDKIEARKRNQDERADRADLLRLGKNVRNIDARIQKRQEEIDELEKFVNFELESTETLTNNSNTYRRLKVRDFDLEIQAIKDLGRIRKQFFDLNQKQDVEDKESAEEKLQLRRIQALAEVDAIKGSEAAKRQARLEINT